MRLESSGYHTHSLNVQRPAKERRGSSDATRKSRKSGPMDLLIFITQSPLLEP